MSLSERQGVLGFFANIVLRRKDMFQELASDMNASFGQLRQKIASLTAIAGQLDRVCKPAALNGIYRAKAPAICRG